LILVVFRNLIFILVHLADYVKNSFWQKTTEVFMQKPLQFIQATYEFLSLQFHP